jgi:hypothetical protein
MACVESSRPVRHACPSYFGSFERANATGLQSKDDGANWVMASIKRAAAAIAAILVREGVDYAQSKAVFNSKPRGNAPGCGRSRNVGAASIG